MVSYEEKDGVGTVEDVDRKGRMITGYLSAFNNVDSHNDVITPGAFTKTIRERKNKILFLNQHRWHEPHGFFKELSEDSIGVKFVSNPLPNTSFSNDTLELYDSGILTQHSIGFRTIKWDYDNDTEIRTIREVKLYEGSNVTVGANSNTPYLGRKSYTLKEIDDLTGKIMKSLRAGNLTDETFLGLEIALKQLQNQSYELGKSDALKEPGEDSTQGKSQMEEAISVIHSFLNN